MIYDDMDVDALDELDDDAFRGAILYRLEPVPLNSAIWRERFCHPALAERTLGCLEELADELDELVMSNEFPSTHAKVKRLNMVRSRIAMVTSSAARATTTHGGINGDEMAMRKELLKRLTLAVDAHRLACINLNLAPEPHDLALWEMLDELRLPERGREGGGPSLAEQIAAGRWQHPQAGLVVTAAAIEAATKAQFAAIARGESGAGS